MDDNWRPEVDALDYFGHQQKRLQVADRRPVIRQASDLVGPGIGATAVSITNFNDPLATYNGYYSANVGPGTAPAMNAPAVGQFIGTVVMDLTLGGKQIFTRLSDGIEFTRTFRRLPGDTETIVWGSWTSPAPASWAVNPGAAGAGGNISPSTSATLALPTGTTRQVIATFSRSGDTININRPGLYTGALSVILFGGTNPKVTIWAPNGASASVAVMTHNAPTGSTSTANIPFTFRMTGSSGQVHATAETGTNVLLYQVDNFYIVRHGDAV